MIPKVKINTYTGTTLDHTITDESVFVYTKEIITDGVGYFIIHLPGEKDGSYPYSDIALNDRVDIYYDWDEVPATPNYSGVVGKITGTLTPNGYVREISGLSRGEVLLRRLKKYKLWDDVDSDDVALEIITDLSLGNELGTQTDNVTVDVKSKSYFDILREISDYWVSAGTQIKQDFYVTHAGNLKWDSRPFRSTGVESLAVGTNILNYSVTQDVEPVFNNIVVYGARERQEPADPDSWTNSLFSWTAVTGTLSLDAGVTRMGGQAVKCSDAAGLVSFYRTFTSTLRDFEKLIFWYHASAGGAMLQNYVRILSPDTSNYFQATIDPWVVGAWERMEVDLGPNHMYDADVNPNEPWTEVGSPRWYNMKGLWFVYEFAAAGIWMNIDGATCFMLGEYSGQANDATSISAYGQRDLDVTDDKLHSDTACESRARTMLYQRKDPPTEATISVNGNNNILVGDRIPLTVPSEGISGVSFDVLTVENSVGNGGWVTTAKMVNTSNIRSVTAAFMHHEVMELKRRLNQLSQGIQRTR